jgi:hypothetical protein
MRENDRIKVHMYAGGKEIKTRNLDKVFRVCKENGNSGIFWNADTFAPFYTFSHDVIFENVKTGEKYHYNNMKECIERIN